jgi:predicted RNase H-related nuclease YkuK (DUF458 family)
MGRKVHCLIDVNDTEQFVELSKKFFLNKGYEIEIDSGTQTIVFEAGSTVWTVLGTTRWTKTDRTVILSDDVKSENHSMKLLYDVAWLSMHYRPQHLVRDEIEQLKEFVNNQNLPTKIEYSTDI